METQEKRLLRNNKGFTLIELIMVIVILGILAAVAIPKYISMKTDAADATAHGITASLSGSIAIKHAQYLIKGDTYDAISVVANVQQSGVTLVCTVATGPITASISGTTYTWTYTPQSGDVAAYVSETSGWT